jgi:ABC-type multidrug transport system ATPase subunit
MGRVASLLEVGTGFHAELTGRENIYLNGAILGMKREEIRRKFDEIVSFAEVERFLDTPVKRYSSGMYVRLAFAVAAHLEPEILIVDEVLAVGDTEFQKKCLGKIGSFANSGRTVLFVTHNLNAARSLCTKAIELSRGAVVGSGAVEEVVNNYLTKLAGSRQRRVIFETPEKRSSIVEIVAAEMPSPEPRYNGDAIEVRFTVKINQAVPLNFFFYVWREEVLAFVASDHHINCVQGSTRD